MGKEDREDITEQVTDVVEDTAAAAGQEDKKSRRRGKRRTQTTQTAEPVVLPHAAIQHVASAGADTATPSPDDQFLQQAFFGKMDPELVTYFKSIEGMLKDDAISQMDAESRELFLNNIYDEVDGKELVLATDFGGSRILERILRISQPFHLRVIMDRMRGVYLQLVTHRFASHVIQMLLNLIAPFIESELRDGIVPNENAPAEEGKLLPLVDLFLQMCSEVMPALTHLITDSYGSHIIRSLLVLLSGVDVDSNGGDKKQSLIKSRTSNKYATSKGIATALLPIEKSLIPTAFNQKLSKIMQALIQKLSPAEVRVFSTHVSAGPMLQMMIITSSSLHTDDGSQLINKILINASDAKLMGSAIKDPVSSHMFQVILKHASNQKFDEILNTIFKGRIAEFAKHHVGNYVIQALLENIKTCEHFEIVSSELCGAALMKELLFEKRAQVVLKYLDLCVQFGADYEKVVTTLEAAFDISEKTSKARFIHLFLGLKQDTTAKASTIASPMDSIDEKPAATATPAEKEKFMPVSGGCALVSKLLSFPQANVQRILNSIFAQTGETVFNWTRSSSASHTLEAIFTSQTLTVKTKKALVRMLNGKIADMALDRYGSFLVEKCWSNGDFQMKETLVQELLSKKTALEGMFQGRKICQLTRLDLYARKRDDWMAMVKGVEKKKRMFDEILGEDTAPVAENKIGVKKTKAEKAKTVETPMPAVEIAPVPKVEPVAVDDSMQTVLQAIASSTAVESPKEKKHKKHKSEKRDKSEKKSKKSKKNVEQ